MILLSKVTAPIRVRALPSRFALVNSEIDWSASIVPLETEFVPRVAEEPTCQKTLEACAPPARITFRPSLVVRSDATWKIQTAFELPCASGVRSPDDIASEVVDL